MGATFDLRTEPGSVPVCSRAGCTETASWRVNWRNPRIHAADRVKIWAACHEHRDFLADYLRSRTFPVRVTGIDEDVDRLDDTRSADASAAEASAADASAADASAAQAGDAGALAANAVAAPPKNEAAG